MKKRPNRLQLEFPDRSWERLEFLREKTEAASYAEVIRNALRLYEAMILRFDEGNRVILKNKNGEETEYSLFG